RAMAECRTWHEALELQSEFTRASFERVAQRATRSAELTAGIIAGSLQPVQEQGRRTLRRVS
ncbi:MAG TPA: phasin family protein, partial [Geminicoccaceae bacterium]|nr:phasin family protein [Geminicoccaceae bacterium]